MPSSITMPPTSTPRAAPRRQGCVPGSPGTALDVSFHAHLSCSWANAVETFFASLTRRRLQRGAFHSLIDLQAAINRYLGEHNRKPKPFIWTADPDRII